MVGNKGGFMAQHEHTIVVTDGKPMILNPSANWNNVEACTAKEYLYSYMAKNLYRLECPVSSEYNYETKLLEKNSEFVELLPIYGINQTPQKKDIPLKDGKSTLTRYVTNNPNLFWTAPAVK